MAGKIVALALAFLGGSAPAWAAAATPVTPTEQVGRASWYGRAHHGAPTSSGEIYDMYALTAAHRTLPFGTRVRVTNVANGRSIDVRVNDRGPAVPSRIIDLSYGAARHLGAVRRGVVRVRVRVLAGATP